MAIALAPKSEVIPLPKVRGFKNEIYFQIFRLEKRGFIPTSG